MSHGLSRPRTASDQSGAWSVAISGDILTRANPGVNIGNIGSPIGVQIVGGSIGGQTSPSGDFPVRIAAATILLGISGDVSTTPKAGQTWLVSQQQVVGVQIVGGAIGGKVGPSGDFTITPSTTNAARIPVSGDKYLTDGANQGTRATVKSYTNSNPLTVVLVNSTGDAYNPSDRAKPIVLETKAGLDTTQGSYVVATAAAGKRLWVTRYEFQGTGVRSYMHLAAAASGAQLTPRWILDTSIEGKVYCAETYPTGLFCTPPGGSLSLEMAGQNTQYALSYFTGDA